VRPLSLLLVLLLLLSGFPLFSEDESSNTIEEPVPYGVDEFPSWVKDVRRGEIIFFGSLPFTLLITTLGYQTVDYLQVRSGPNPEEAVWGNLTEDDRKTVLVASLGSALVIAVADFVLGRIFDD
jgi:hypothetical protein